MSSRSKILAASLLVMLAAACGGPRKKAPETRPFPKVVVPEAYTDTQDRVAYAGEHYWDAYFAGDGITDSLHILGVTRDEVEQALANYIAMLDMAPLSQAQACMGRLFGAVEAAGQRDTASHVYTQFTQMVALYLYDPNSPLRDEDLYLPFVRRMAESPLTHDDMRVAYRYEAMTCAINPRGSKAPDFRAHRPNGTSFSLYGIKARNTLLFFSNPGCHACREIVEQIQSVLGAKVADGSLAVVNIYIDDDEPAWREYVHNYPPEWYTGYDTAHVIRDEMLYDVRAIPSVYLLDADKKILLKDATMEKVILALQ